MTDFSPDTAVYNDPIGLAAWRIGHQREHTQFVTTLAKGSGIVIPDFPLADIGSGRGEQQIWLDTHQRAHDFVRQATGVSGIDLADLDLHDRDAWYIWMAAHSLEHQKLRAALGLT